MNDVRKKIGLLTVFAALCLFVAPQIASADPGVGDQVECNWKGGGKLYKGKIAELRGDKIYVHYNDGDKEETTASMCNIMMKPTTATVGDRVQCNWKGGGKLYKGKIAELRGKKIYVHYNDGDKEETTLAMCLKAVGPVFAVGDAVKCNWKGKKKLYQGKIAEIRGDKIYVHYNDGDKEETSPVMCRK